MRVRPVVLVIGGSDSSGGAGISRDITVLAAFAVDAAVAITAVTAQTDQKVSRIEHVLPELIADQISCALAARPIAAIKIGMLGCQASLDAVLAALPANGPCPVVLDPVLTASSGGALLDAEAIASLRLQLIPRATLLTPNLPEAAVLLQCSPAQDERAMLAQARALLEFGSQAVLLKGGHASDRAAVDLLVTQHGVVERLCTPRLATKLRGTGCMLSSAIAAGLASQNSLLLSCAAGKRYVTEQLQRTLDSRST